MLIAYEKNILIFYFVCFKLYSGGRKTTHKIVILDPKNRDSLVAKKILIVSDPVLLDFCHKL